MAYNLKHLARLTLVILLVSLLTSCKLAAQDDPPAATPVVERETSPSTVDLPTLIADNSAFAFDLYRQLTTEQDGNLVFSPYSISLALAMVYAGARGDTAVQMAGTLHYTLPAEQLHPAFNALDRLLEPQDSERLPTPTNNQFGGSPAGDLILHTANAVWGQTGFPFEQPYLETLGRNYGAGLNPVDFSANPQAAWQTISQWVAQATQGHIENMPPQEAITTQTRLVLVNAIYFQGEWTYPFQAENTYDSAFYLLDGSAVTVPMMVNGFAYMDCGRGEDYYAVQLTYGARENAAMLILLPDAGTFTTFESSLDASMFSDVLAALERTNTLTLNMPRFEFDGEIDLIGTFSAMGLTLPFGGGADFSGISPSSLFIDYAAHRATISVDEQGTEASGATFVSMALSAMFTDCRGEVTVDRPFIFAIYDRTTGAILFLGRVLNPVG